MVSETCVYVFESGDKCGQPDKAEIHVWHNKGGYERNAHVNGLPRHPFSPWTTLRETYVCMTHDDPSKCHKGCSYAPVNEDWLDSVRKYVHERGKMSAQFGDDIHWLHAGTEREAALSLSDVRALVARIDTDAKVIAELRANLAACCLCKCPREEHCPEFHPRSFYAAGKRCDKGSHHLFASHMWRESRRKA